VVENPEKSGIIRGMAANDIIIGRDDGKITAYNPKADYSVSIPGLPDAVNNGLSDACRRVAKAGSENRCEAMELVDLKTGKSRFDELGEYDQVGGEKFWNFIEQHPEDRFAFIHNHPSVGFLSYADMQTFTSNEQIQVMVSTSNNGLKRIAYGDTKDTRLLDMIYQNDVNQLRNRIRHGSLEMADYRTEFQKLVVENAVRDYANLGFWEVDGRV